MTQNKYHNLEEQQNNVLWPPADEGGQSALFNGGSEERKHYDSDLEGVNKEAMREVIEESGFGIFADNAPAQELEGDLIEPSSQEGGFGYKPDEAPMLFSESDKLSEDNIIEAMEPKDNDGSGDFVKVQKSKLELIKQLADNISESSQRINELLNNQFSESDLGARLSSMVKRVQETSDESDDGKIIEGVFNGQCMIGPDGKQYSIPSNYASKSKLVEGDILKLTISPVGKFIYKQIGPIERSRIVGVLTSSNSEFYVENEDRRWKILTASVTYFKGKNGDEAVILVPKHGDSIWAAVENIINKI